MLVLRSNPAHVALHVFVCLDPLAVFDRIYGLQSWTLEPTW